MPDETYNGWTNRATWLMSMYLDVNYDGEGTYSDTRDMVETVRSEQTGSLRFAEILESYVTDRFDDIDGGFLTDMLSVGMAQVNWRELAESLLSES